LTERHYPCEYCDTEHPQEDKLVTLTLQRKGRWYIFENVPARVCPNCGHRYYDGPTMLRLEEMMQAEPKEGHAVEAWAFSLPVGE